MPWLDFNDVLRRNNFERVLNYTFISPFYSDKVEDEFALWAEHDLGLLLRAESKNFHGKKVLHLINLYFELYIPKKLYELDPIENQHLEWIVDEGIPFDILSERKQRPEDRRGETFIVSNIMDEGLVDYLKSIKCSEFKPNNPWKYFNMNITCLSDSLDENAYGTNWEAYKKINKNKVKLLPEKTQRMLGLIK